MSVNAELAERFELISKMIDLLGEDSFRASAYARASRTIEDVADDLARVVRDAGADAKKTLTGYDGVGPKIADKIIEFVTTGKIAELDELSARVPKGLLPLLGVSGLGPKTVSMLWNTAGVTSLADLKRIIADKSILELPRMGAKAVEKISAAIAVMETGQERMPLGKAVPIADKIVKMLLGVKGIVKAEAAGSLRRGRDTIGDIDIILAADSAKSSEAASKVFSTMPGVVQIIVSGPSKTSVRLAIKPEVGRYVVEGESGDAFDGPAVQVDLRVVDEASFGAALLYFTGSKEHNVRLRELALKSDLTLNEYGLFPEDDEKTPPQSRGVKPVASRTEAEVYAALEMAWVPPEMREDKGEMEAFALDAKPAKKSKAAPVPSGKASKHQAFDVDALVTIEKIKSELHAHTKASDGSMTILELAKAAKARGFHTIAVTDHSKSSAIAGGLSPERLRAHIKDVHATREKIDGITILAGSEVDILADGTLDYDDELLAMLDIVVASPHAGLSQDSAAATKRLLKVVTHPLVHILGHPTGRRINQRVGINPDFPEIVAAAVEHRTALEINAHWLRLDMRDSHARVAAEKGALVAIDCDTHAPGDMDNLRFGVTTARRGWVLAERVVNTWEARELHVWLKSKR